MKICLIRPAILVPKRNVTAMFTPPLGLAYVAGSLKRAGHDVTLIDAVGESLDTRHEWRNDCYIYGLNPEQTIARVTEGTQVIGVAAGFSFEWPYTRDLIDALRARFPKAMLICGGEHFSAMPEYSLENSGLDMGVMGEGEETALELMAELAKPTPDLSQVLGLAFKDKDGVIRVNARRPRTRELDDLPWPAWELMPIENYLERGFGFGVNRGRSMPVMASRGCPYQCTFCSNPQMWTTRWTVRDQDKLLDELQHYQQHFGAQNFDFYDLTAIVKKDWIVSFCSKIKQRGMTFTWQLPSGTRSEAIDEEVAGLLYETGCRNLSYSPESGSPATLEKIKKKIHPPAMLASIRGCVRQGLNVKTNIMLGFPGETLKEVLESYRFIAGMAWNGAHDLSVWAFSPYPGSELFEQLKASGALTFDDDYFDSLRSYADASRTKSYSANFTNERLKTLRFIGTALFYAVGWLRRPARPFHIVWNVLHGKQESRGEMALANMLRRGKLKTG